MTEQTIRERAREATERVCGSKRVDAAVRSAIVPAIPAGLAAPAGPERIDCGALASAGVPLGNGRNVAWRRR